MQVMRIKSNIRDYDVCFNADISFIKPLLEIPNSVFIVDGNVWNIYSNNLLNPLWGKDLIVFPIHEDKKNLQSVEEIYDYLLQKNAKKNLTLIVVGGGILQDISGFVASTLYRGVNWILIPTTLLAQSDSCVGSKTSLNYKGYKNLIGSFYPPSQVIIHTPFLKSLSEGDYFSGLGEVIKLCIMGGERSVQEYQKYFKGIIERDNSTLEKTIIRSLKTKKSFMKGDEFDQGRRNMLNYGHCFGHAIETSSNFRIPHGQAVVTGMILANIVAQSRGLLTEKTFCYLNNKLLLSGLIIKPDHMDLDPNKIIEGMKKDKKRVGMDLTLIMAKEGYEMIKVDDLVHQEVKIALSALKKILY